MRDRELPAKLSALDPQPHGGALHRGGVPGHNGKNAGRPSSELRERLKGSVADRVPVLEAIADDPDAAPSDRIRAIDVLAKYGLGTVREVSVDEVRERVRRTLEVLRASLGPDQAAGIVEQLREVWR